MNHERWCGELVGALEALIKADRWSTGALAAGKVLRQFEAEKAAWESKHAPPAQASLFEGSRMTPASGRYPVATADVPYRPYVNRTTSIAAADAMQVHVAINMRERVFMAIVGAGEDGLTDEEIAARTQISSSTVRPRRGELEGRGRIEDSGKTRPGKSGRQFTVYIAILETTP